MKIAIIGSGVTGLTCARRLIAAGHNPVVFDKGRGLGGRLATRRAEPGVQFDHGAQMIPCATHGFRTLLDAATSAGFVAPWDTGTQEVRYVGTPGMTGFAKFLAQGVDLHQATEITSVTHHAKGWDIASDAPLGRFDRVICTVPAPQATRLVGAALPHALDPVLYDPSLTLMVALTREIAAPDTRTDPSETVAWIARDSAKPGRPSRQCWVVQAAPAWSAAHLERSKDEIATLMLDPFLAMHGLGAADVAHATAHRWRYARVVRPLGTPFVASQDATLHAGGDWCLGPTVEHAWQSGTAIADDILASA